MTVTIKHQDDKPVPSSGRNCSLFGSESDCNVRPGLE